MIPTAGVWKKIWGGILVLLILVLPILVGYDVYLQWNTATMDFFTDSPGSSTVSSVIKGGQAEAAGLEAGDVILTIDDQVFNFWYSPQIGKAHIVKVERRGDLVNLFVPAVQLIQINYLPLICAIIVSLAFWGIGTLLLIRRFWNTEIRLLFLLSQTIAIALLFPLSFPNPWNIPEWMYPIQNAGFCFIAPLGFHYSITYPTKLGHINRRFWILLLLYCLVSLLCFVWSQNHTWEMQLNIGFFSFVTALSITFMLYQYQYRSNQMERRRSRVIAFGVMIALILPVLFYLLPRAINSPYRMPEWAAGLFLIIAPISYLYATLRYNLFGIDRLLNRTLVYTIMSLGIFIVYLGPYLFLYKYLPDDWFIQLVFIFCLTLWIGWTFDWLRSRTQRLVDKLFYGGWYDYPTVVEVISDALTRSSSRDEICTILNHQISNLMRLNTSTLWIGSANSTIPSSPSMKAQFRYNLQTNLPAQWIVDSHRDGDDLSDADNRILHTIAQQVEIALNNVILIETLQNQLDEIRASREALAKNQHQLMRSREEERSRLARDLHDSPIQSLVGINIQLGLLLNEKNLGVGLAESLTEMRNEVRQLSSELRQVCADLRPPMLDTLGLSAALRSLINEWAEQNKIETTLDLCPDAALRSLPGEVSVNLYRVAQEALANISKHAKSQHVKISLSWNDKRLVMIIQDDGIGFNTPDTLYEMTANNHFGLAGMKERVNLIDGEWSLKSIPGEGTIVSVSWQPDRVIE